MIVVDTSALFAILANEPEATSFLEALSRDGAPVISAVTLYETMIVCQTRGGEPLLDDLRQLLAVGNIKTVAFDGEAAEAARAAYAQFGKNRHPAKLNFADAAAYSLAGTLGCALLYKGDDFTKTGVLAAVRPSSGPPTSNPAPAP